MVLLPAVQRLPRWYSAPLHSDTAAYKTARAAVDSALKRVSVRLRYLIQNRRGGPDSYRSL